MFDVFRSRSIGMFRNSRHIATAAYIKPPNPERR